MNARRVVRRTAQYLGLVRDDRAASVQEAPGGSARGHADDLVVIVVFVPEGWADAVRNAAASAGAGAIGEYRACSFSVTGSGRFEPIGSARPAIGQVGRPEVVVEQRVEVICSRRLAGQALRAMLAVHPYEEPAHHVYRTIDPRDL